MLYFFIMLICLSILKSLYKLSYQDIDMGKAKKLIISFYTLQCIGSKISQFFSDKFCGFP